VDLTTGFITTICGTGVAGYSGDFGPASVAQLSSPFFAKLDPTGKYLDIGDAANLRVRRIDLSSGQLTITTLAGRGTPAGFSGEGGPANAAALSFPSGIAHDQQNSVYFSDTLNQRIREVVAGS